MKFTDSQAAALLRFEELDRPEHGAWHRKGSLKLGRNGWQPLIALRNAGLIEELRVRDAADPYRYDRRITAAGLEAAAELRSGIAAARALGLLG